MSTDAYIAARAAYVQADQSVDEIAAIISRVANALEQSRVRFIFSNLNVNLPAEVSMSRDKVSIDVNDWKTPSQIQESLANWHAARDTLIMEWAALTDDEKAGSRPPPRGVHPDFGLR